MPCVLYEMTENFITYWTNDIIVIHTTQSQMKAPTSAHSTELSNTEIEQEEKITSGFLTDSAPNQILCYVKDHHNNLIIIDGK